MAKEAKVISLHEKVDCRETRMMRLMSLTKAVPLKMSMKVTRAEIGREDQVN